MSISVGDKYVIEIGAVAELPEGKKKYFIKPFESLVFDRKGLKQLEKFDRLALKEYDLGYKKGYEDGKNEATHNTELIPELKKAEYTKGYNSAINDYNGMIQWLHDCTNDFKEFMNKKYGYDVMYLTNPRVDEGVMLYDIICDQDIAEVISEFQKQREEFAKCKVGDEVFIDDKGRKAIVSRVLDNGLYNIVFYNGDTGCVDRSFIAKTGKQYDIESILKELGE